MMNIAASLLRTFWPYIAGAVAFIAGALGIYAKGRSDANAKAAAGKAKAAEKSTKEMNNVDTMRDADDAARIERLRRFERDNRP